MKLEVDKEKNLVYLGNKRYGIATVIVGDKELSISELDPITLNIQWSKLKRELNDLYAINKKYNSGIRGKILKLMGINLPERNIKSGDAYLNISCKYRRAKGE